MSVLPDHLPEIADLESVITTAELSLRPSRAPNYAAESRALVALSNMLAASPNNILQGLAESALELCGAHTAGVSLLKPDESRFYWPAIAGRWAKHVGGGTPREFGPCGTVLDRNAAQLMSHPERRFPYLAEATPAVEEVLLIPFYLGGKAVGTIWVVMHDESRRFDSEDLRIMTNLGAFAAAAYQTLQTLAAAAKANQELKQIAATLRQSEQRLRDTDHRKDEFLATLAHELRNPVAPVVYSLELMKTANGDADIIEKARSTMQRQMGHMVRLIDDLLDLSRITRDKLELRKGRTELASIIHHAVEACRAMTDTARHDLQISLLPEPIYLHADPVRIAQVFGNLLTNACKYTDPGGRISVKVERQGGEAVVSVKDNGIGIPPEMLSDVFEMFTQVDRSLERSQGGLGIGLTLVKRLVEAHGGTVSAHSKGLGHGSEFIVRLPTLIDAPTEQPPPPKHADTAMTGRRILVVDDNADSADCLSRLLELAGYQTQTVHDGAEAIEKAEEFKPDAILLDIGLPGMNGYDVCRAIRERPLGKQIFMAALTGWGQDEDRRISREAGFDAHLVKPVDYAVLVKLLESEPRATNLTADSPV